MPWSRQTFVPYMTHVSIDQYATFLGNLTVFILGGRLLLRFPADHYRTFLYILALRVHRATMTWWFDTVKLILGCPNSVARWLSSLWLSGLSSTRDLYGFLNIWLWWFQWECEECQAKYCKQCEVYVRVRHYRGPFKSGNGEWVVAVNSETSL